MTKYFVRISLALFFVSTHASASFWDHFSPQAQWSEPGEEFSGLIPMTHDAREAFQKDVPSLEILWGRMRAEAKQDEDGESWNVEIFYTCKNEKASAVINYPAEKNSKESREISLDCSNDEKTSKPMVRSVRIPIFREKSVLSVIVVHPRGEGEQGEITLEFIEWSRFSGKAERRQRFGLQAGLGAGFHFGTEVTSLGTANSRVFSGPNFKLDISTYRRALRREVPWFFGLSGFVSREWGFTSAVSSPINFAIFYGGVEAYAGLLKAIRFPRSWALSPRLSVGYEGAGIGGAGTSSILYELYPTLSALNLNYMTLSLGGTVHKLFGEREAYLRVEGRFFPLGISSLPEVSRTFSLIGGGLRAEMGIDLTRYLLLTSQFKWAALSGAGSSGSQAARDISIELDLRWSGLFSI